MKAGLVVATLNLFAMRALLLLLPMNFITKQLYQLKILRKLKHNLIGTGKEVYVGYRVHFAGSLNIDPPIKDINSIRKIESISDNNHNCWVLLDEGDGITESENNGSNYKYKEELQEIVSYLVSKGHEVTGLLYYQGEEPLYGSCGLLSVVDGKVVDKCYGSVINTIRRCIE